MQSVFFRHVFDASSLIEIERKSRVRKLRQVREHVVIPKKVAEEVRKPRTPLQTFVRKYPRVVVPFQGREGQIYLRVMQQPGIHEGDAAAIAVAMSRGLPLVVEDVRARAKAEGHGVKCLRWTEFLGGALS